MKTIKEKIAVMQAYADGKQIEMTPHVPERWQAAGIPLWNWSAMDYRIKPEPRTFYIYPAYYTEHFAGTAYTEDQKDLIDQRVKREGRDPILWIKVVEVL